MQAVRVSTMAQTPIDLDHLTRQTLGDATVQREVLELFLREMEAARCKLSAPQNRERAELAHRIRGAASGVGAISLAASAAALEAEPDRIELAAALLVRMHEAVCFIAERGLR
jgi:HPt (histidine-containing phosphotransfer) domain-containing protein